MYWLSIAHPPIAMILLDVIRLPFVSKKDGKYKKLVFVGDYGGCFDYAWVNYYLDKYLDKDPLYINPQNSKEFIGMPKCLNGMEFYPENYRKPKNEKPHSPEYDAKFTVQNYIGAINYFYSYLLLYNRFSISIFFACFLEMMIVY